MSSPPAISFEKAKESQFYTFMMIDPDAGMLGSWPEAAGTCRTPCPKPVRHWLAVNIPGSDLQRGDLSNSLNLSVFVAPKIPMGSHRYGKWIFSTCIYDFNIQPSGFFLFRQQRREDFNSLVAAEKMQADGAIDFEPRINVREHTGQYEVLSCFIVELHQFCRPVELGTHRQ